MQFSINSWELHNTAEGNIIYKVATSSQFGHGKGGRQLNKWKCISSELDIRTSQIVPNIKYAWCITKTNISSLSCMPMGLTPHQVTPFWLTNKAKKEKIGFLEFVSVFILSELLGNISK